MTETVILTKKTMRFGHFSIRTETMELWTMTVTATGRCHGFNLSNKSRNHNTP